MLIDSTHRKWSIAAVIVGAAAYVLYRVANAVRPEPMTGGDFLGLWYGVIGTLFMIYAGMLSAHREAPVRRWYMPRKTWLRGHIWLGSLSLLFIWCHSGFSWGGTLEFSLWIVLLLLILSGWFGMLVQWVMPRLLTNRVRYEAPYEQIPHLCAMMRRQADAAVDAACGPYDPSPHAVENTLAAAQYASDARAQLRDFYETAIRPFFEHRVPKKHPLRDPVQIDACFDKLGKLPGMDELGEQVAKLKIFCHERRMLLDQERLHVWLHAWLLLHVPLSVALLVLGLLHIVMSLKY